MADSNKQTRLLALKPKVVITPLEDSALLLDLDSKYFYSVNQPGWAILQMLEAGSAREQVVSEAETWGATRDDAGAIQRFIDALIADGLVQENGDGGSGTAEVSFSGAWSEPTIERYDEPLERIITSAFDPSVPLAE